MSHKRYKPTPVPLPIATTMKAKNKKTVDSTTSGPAATGLALDVTTARNRVQAAKLSLKEAKKALKGARKAFKTAKRLAKKGSPQKKVGSAPIIIGAGPASSAEGAAANKPKRTKSSARSSAKVAKGSGDSNPAKLLPAGPKLSAATIPATVVDPRIAKQPAPRAPAAQPKATSVPIKPAPAATTPRALPATTGRPAAPAANGALRPLSRATSAPAQKPQAMAPKAAAVPASVPPASQQNWPRPPPLLQPQCLCPRRPRVPARSKRRSNGIARRPQRATARPPRAFQWPVRLRPLRIHDTNTKARRGEPTGCTGAGCE